MRLKNSSLVVTASNNFYCSSSLGDFLVQSDSSHWPYAFSCIESIGLDFIIILKYLEMLYRWGKGGPMLSGFIYRVGN